MTTDSSAPPPTPARQNPFAKFDSVALADAIGDLHVAGERNAKLMKAAKAEMARRHLLSLVGARFEVSKGVEDERRLDTDGLKAKYGLAWYEGWYKTIARTKWSIRAKPAAELGVPA